MAMDENNQPLAQEQITTESSESAFGSIPPDNESAMASTEMENLFLAADGRSESDNGIPASTSLGTEAFEHPEQLTDPIADFTSSMGNELIMDNSDGNAGLDELYEKIYSLETALDKLERLEQRIQFLESENAQSTNELSIMGKQLKAIGALVETLTKGIINTPLYDAHEKFICNGCGSKGDVAMVVRCTKCGRERWVGWWP